MSIVTDAKNGTITEEMKKVAEFEGVEPEFVRRGIAAGRIVIPVTPYRDIRVCGIGEGLTTKVNASIGASSDIVDEELEVEKAKAAQAAGADTLMELGTGGDFLGIRKKVCDAIDLSVGSVPLYQAFISAAKRDGSIVHMTEDDLWNATEEQAKLGTNFMAIHTGINNIVLDRLKAHGRYGGLCSRGGAFMSSWMLHNEAENPLYKDFDYLCEILKEHEVTLSTGNGMRAGAVHDATDRAQIQELIINSECAQRAHDEYDLQVIVEGPGHVPLDEIDMNVKLMKSMSDHKPFYMLGPLVTDVAPGRDHIVTAIGASQSAAAGCDFLCYVTPAEHLALPNKEDVIEGVKTSKIAAHVGDMVKLNKRDQDLAMARARRDLDWEKMYSLALDPELARDVRNSRAPEDTDACTMCGNFCALKIVNQNYDLAK
ncbi:MULTISPECIES: phosphomethylpyrimidine synthase ThiC [Methanohalophilus]|jgi:phosphomethylpyrimidine synthase|uniref:Phosphomethylpyrimidine synthase n=1 Tax=Methanohalophilus euhalobius TaxID=51203 RepID=A0A315A130_9EURY|nr:MULTISPECIES: phosphomethylpyrimidine synthase ThiC [Methanohalophilus]KXS46847.1 MAG: thiamine biosynthesis protein ThiC [Methanohalophilus sp. T328-1]RSD35007.1 MAG: thiamine biosynthesis protein ThiC [Methanohalophilus sp.]OBZ35440.1 MAG: phosphomethylpyrimidine synthase [Methanohalophilus sp. DAL1]PQV43108.1 phosphomethylpyrimidine synthase [Methanohalophilus euhalobius]RNI09325.1 phosphomethylpyrimidine synthase ThiC [Methanohalophilus euhalobius]